MLACWKNMIVALLVAHGYEGGKMRQRCARAIMWNSFWPGGGEKC